MGSYFSLNELNCPCCKRNEIKKLSLDSLNVARETANMPFIINSAYRCEERNKLIGGSETSSHLRGYAFDIRASTSADRFKIIKACISAGFNRIGVYPSFVHVDNDPDKTASVMWYGD